MNPSYAYTNGSPKGPPVPPPSPPPPPTATLGKKSTPPRLRRRGFTIGADDDESSDGENAGFGFGGGYSSAGAANGAGARTGSPAGKRGKSKEKNKPAEETATNAPPVVQRKQRRRGRSLRKTALLRPSRSAFDVVPNLPSANLTVPGMPLSLSTTTTAPLTNGSGSMGVGARRTSSPGSIKLPSPVLAPPGTIIGGSAIYDSAGENEGNAYRGSGGVSRYGRGRSASIVMVMPRTRQEEIDSAADTAYWGWVVGASTWFVFVIGMGSVLGVWEWAWDVPGSPFPILPETHKREDEGAFPIPGYYPALIILTCIMAWVWVVVAWVGMKYFKHTKIQPPSDDLL